MLVQHDRFPNLRVFEHALIQHKLTLARRADTPARQFRALLNDIAGLMTFAISGELPTKEVDVETPLEATRGLQLSRPVTLVPILRAGIGLTEGILALMPEARVGHIGLYRDEASLEPIEYYMKMPADIADGPVFMIDPMLATGGSAAHAVVKIKELGCTDIQFVCLVCAPEGVTHMAEMHPDVAVYTASLDRELNDKGYILPGLGDAGDRIFGTM